MSSLNIFPIEILEWISSMLVPSELMRLWQCGDRILNMKFANGGATSTTLCWSSTPWMPWPRSFFTLFTRLTTVNWTVDTRSSLCPSLDLSFLPKTLRCLQLECDDVYHVLRQQNANLNVLLPALQILKLKGKRISEENLKRLPQQLIELSVFSEDDTVESKRLSKISSKDLFRDLPPNLEHLTFILAIVDLGEVGNDLPSGLKSLELWFIESNFDWFLKLPKSIKKLIIKSTNLHRSDLHALLPELEEVDVWQRLSNSDLPLLPIGITSLRLPMAPSFTDEDMERFPKNLTRLEIHPPQRITPAALQRLPTTLTDSSFSVVIDHPETLSFYNPETIRMSLVKGAMELNLYPFPRKLTSLTIDCINNDICELLPPHLTYLKLDGGLITAKGASNLPRYLKHLSVVLGVFDADETISHIGYIPCITVSHRSGAPALKVTNKWLSFLKPSPPLIQASEDIIDRTHPSSGHTLELQAWDLANLLLEEAAFLSLPAFTHLAVLHITASSGTFISSSYIQHVPKSLTDLEIGCLLDFPTVSELSTLPNCLRFLELWVKFDTPCIWVDSDLEALPRTLQIFNLNCGASFHKLSANITSSLPPYLMEMNVNNAAIYRFKKPLDRLYPQPIPSRSTPSQDKKFPPSKGQQCNTM